MRKPLLYSQSSLLRPQQTSSWINPYKKQLKKEEIENVLHKWHKTDEALIQIFQSYSLDTNELKQAIDEMVMDQIEKLNLFLQVLIVLAKTRKERYAKYIQQILFSDTIQQQIRHNLLNLRQPYLQQNQRQMIANNDTETIDSLIIILENVVFYLYSNRQVEQLIDLLMSRIVDKQYSRGIENQHIFVWQKLAEKIKNIKKLLTQYSHQFRQQPYGLYQEFSQDYTYKSCPTYPCELDYSLPENYVTVCGDLDQNFKSAKDYLKYHYLLLREDYLINFRNSIIFLRQNGFNNIHQAPLEQIYLYYNVGVETIYATTKTFKVLVSAIAYDKLNREINWKRSKRLLSGALIVLTSTKLKDFIYAQVQDRPEENKSENRCYFTIKILNIQPSEYIEKLNKYLATNDQLIMLENAVFFDVYQFYLGCLQNKNTENYPFQQQIIFNVQETPKQYNQIDITSMTSRLNNLFARYDKQQKILDPSQQKAIQTILNNKISLIQGPPGTGKTFCGALAVNLLLQESYGRPIIIICQTNHALDQFLEHIIEFCGMNSVVRIGGRCKQQAFEPILLQNIRQKKTKIHFDWPNLYYSKDATNYLLSNSLQTVDNVHYKDVEQHLPDLVSKIIKQYLQTQNVQFKKEISQQAKQIIIHMWLDCYKPRRQQLEKIIEIESKYNNPLIKSDNNKQNFKEVNLNTDFQKQFQIQEQKEIQVDDANENQVLDSDEEEDRKIYVEADQDYQSILKLIDEKISLKRQINRLIYSAEQYNEALDNVYQNDIEIWDMPQNQRNAIQQYILQEKLQSLFQLNNNKSRMVLNFQELLNKLQELNMKADLEIIQNKQIVGLTLSGCAKYAQKLSDLNYSVMVVEEAGEVLESHLVAVLTHKVQHLIMIGDHQQLRPNLNCYSLQQKFNANISLFEKLIKQGLEYVTLQYQRRMKSKFADFIRLIYQNYQDHNDIEKKNQMNVSGVQTDLLYFNHKWDENSDNYSSSKQNKYEGRMIVLFTEYLLKQKIPAEKITILSTYGKQALFIQNEINRKVKVQTVDNFQGEENDIIIISLVRSNKNMKLGFVSIANRICVALSRARIGLYVFGNFDFILEATQLNIQRNNGSDLWLKIIQLAKDKNVLQNYIPLKCDSHDEITQIKQIYDWSQVRNGGCTKKCQIKFPCGHICIENCHKFDHKIENCQSKCIKILKCDHICQGKCSQIPCPPCNTIVKKHIPKCGHIIDLACSESPYKAQCSAICNEITNCGHQCKLQCWEDCNKNVCLEQMTYTHPQCQHQSQIVCSDQKYINKVICKVDCTTLLQCGHKCKGICGLCTYKFHQPCKSTCDILLDCGHQCLEKCGFDCNCKSKCQIICNCNIQCNKKCVEECFICQNKCQLQCIHSSCQKLCWEYCDREPCNSQCNKLLKCGCQCIGLCGEICPLICEIADHNENEYVENTNSQYYQLECQLKHNFKVDILDDYFENQDLKKLIKCPQCKTIIWKSSRYQQYIKETLNHYQAQKTAQVIKLATEEELEITLQFTNDLLKYIRELKIKDKQSFLDNLSNDLQKEIKSLASGKKCKITQQEHQCMEFQINFYKKLIELINCKIDNHIFKHHCYILQDQYLLNEEFRKLSTNSTLWKIEQKLETLYLYKQIMDKGDKQSTQVSQQLLAAIEKQEFFLTTADRNEIVDNLEENQALKQL